MALLSMLALFAPAWTGAGAAHTAAAAPVQPAQPVATLSNAHDAHARPSLDSLLIESVMAARPITGERTVLPVLGRANGAKGTRWLHVRLPGRPNGITGWIRQRGTTVSAATWHIVIDRARRRLTVYRAGRIVRSARAVVGKPSTPTPRGEFFVEETVQLRTTDAGAPFALALSARSDVLQEFDGGPGQIAIHGLANVGGVPGTAVSHGCVRLDGDTMVWLAARIGPGVPVTID